MDHDVLGQVNVASQKFVYIQSYFELKWQLCSVGANISEVLTVAIKKFQ
jgi:hypothetical protein